MKLIPVTQQSPGQFPLFVEPVSAGFPSVASDYVDEFIDLNTHLIKHPSATYFLRVTGSSMVEARIHEGDLVIVDSSLEAKEGDIVIATVDGDFTIKRLQLSPAPALLPMNSRMSPIYLQENEELAIFGVVTFIVYKAL